MTLAVTATTRLAGVVGAPISHSLSPLIHNAWIDACGLDAVYVAFPVAPSGLASLVEAFRGGLVLGLNITAPFKEQALLLANQASLRAQDAGAANLLLFRGNGTVEADNTDGEGLLGALLGQGAPFDPRARPSLVLGAGGAARGAVSALLKAGAPGVFIVNRDRARGEALAKSFGERASAPSSQETKMAMASVGAVINATPAGLEAASQNGVDLAALAIDAVVMDMAYRPLITPLLASARARGLTTVDGLEMLIGQARPSFEAIFGRPSPNLNVRSLVLGS